LQNEKTTGYLIDYQTGYGKRIGYWIDYQTGYAKKIDYRIGYGFVKNFAKCWMNGFATGWNFATGWSFATNFPMCCVNRAHLPAFHLNLHEP
jgi:hypothetical protein